jgi:RNA polymerase sigma-70 factor (ECF subfamily)
MFYLNELSVNEIHELTEISIANIKVLLHRGRKHLYAGLNDLLKTEIKNLM